MYYSKKATITCDFLVNSWGSKRLFLNIVWGFLNVFFLYYVTILILSSDWVFIWISGVLIYVALYWIIAAILFDYLIGDEIDNV